MQEIFAALASFLLIEPLQAEITERLAKAGAPQAVVSEVTACAKAATPIIIERTASDPGWASSTAVRLWMGSAEPGAILTEIAPACAPAVRAAHPSLREQEV
ncbi:hypothetical protein [Microvirga roseola]|uniref:hypothetical protein n=1 Tax=Microvirga roseola TaxID=2883126 RepID=UPI001E3939A1|nr:hypothetical protein [Microvirga roseola]